jgi:Helix-turn-helix domain
MPFIHRHPEGVTPTTKFFSCFAQCYCATLAIRMKTRAQSLTYIATETDAKGRLSQRARLLRLLLSANEIGLPEILDLRISQYNARISELRGQGFDIRNRSEHIDGVVHSWFRLVDVDERPRATGLPLFDLASGSSRV